jgi:mono/diheme cytochrome c family protein
LYKHHCAACHGVDAKGGGPTAAVLKIAVPDLTAIYRRSKGKFTAAMIEKIISGETPVATPAHGSRQMPIWGPVFSQVEWDQNLGRIRTHNLAKYIESLQKK